MQFAIVGCGPQPEVLAHVAADRAREDQRPKERARRHVDREIEMAAAARSRRKSQVNGQELSARLAAERAQAGLELRECAKYASIPVEHSAHVGRILDVQW